MKRHLMRTAALLLVLLVAFAGFSVQGFAAARQDATLTIIHVNDRHGRMGADPYISQLLQNTEGNVLLLDAGDSLHGQTTANLSEGEAMVELMNAVGYSAMVPGNHDFNYGPQRLVDLAAMMDFPLLAANVRGAYRELLFEPYTVFPMDGLTVGVFGLATPETVAASDPRLMEGLSFDDPMPVAEETVAQLKAEGCDVIVALAHLGPDELSLPANRSDTLAAVPGIDVIIDGHSHTVLETGRAVGNTLIAQAGEYGEYIGVVEISLAGGSVSKTASLLAVPPEGDESSLLPDEQILAKIVGLDAENEELTGIVLGHTPVNLQGEKETVRTQETNLANLITDSMRWATGADAAFLSGGNIRASIPAGDITMGQVLTTLPYSNLLVTVELSGEELLSVLEHGVSMYPEPVGQHIQVAGLAFAFDPSAQPGSRVTKVSMATNFAAPVFRPAL